jgi:hypothetical protein
MTQPTVSHDAPQRELTRRLALVLWAAHATGEGALPLPTAIARTGSRLPPEAARASVDAVLRRGMAVWDGPQRLRWVDAAPRS